MRLQKPFLIASLCCFLLAAVARAQQQPPEDPEDEKQIGLWLDQGVSAGLSSDKSLEVEFYERLDEGASNLFEYFVQGGVAFRLRPWITIAPMYRYQRFPGNPAIDHENRPVAECHVEHIEGALATHRPHSYRGAISREP